MLSRFSTRREFINYGRLSLLFLLYSCGNNSNKVKISLQKSFYPKSFKDTIPKWWTKEEMNFDTGENLTFVNLDNDTETLCNDTTHTPKFNTSGQLFIESSCSD